MRTFGRVRLDVDEALLLRQVIDEARQPRIARKVKLRDAPNGEPEHELDAVRWELKTLNRLTEEVDRALEDIHGHTSTTA